MLGSRWRLGALAVASMTAASGLAVLVAASPAAAENINEAPVTSLAYTQSAHPGKIEINPPVDTDIPLGTDATGDTARIYVTFDLSAYAGQHIVSASLSATSSLSIDTPCDSSNVVTYEVWQTDVQDYKISWVKAPSEESQIGTMSFGDGCPGWYTHADLTSAIAAAVAAGDTSFALEIRESAATEGEPGTGTTIGHAFNGTRSLGLYVTYNLPPDVPTALLVDNKPCSDSEPGIYDDATKPRLMATFIDPDGVGSMNEYAEGIFDIWPADDPSDVTEYTSIANVMGPVTAYLPAGVVTDGTTYGWRVRGSDGTDMSDWSPTCYFTSDLTKPAAPGVTSPNFPPGQEGPPGVPATFTFTTNGSDDVVGFYYAFNQFVDVPTYVPVGPDGSATATISPPNTYPLDVWSIDRAGNQSPETEYDLRMPFNQPQATLSTDQIIVGQPVTLSLSPNPNAGTVDSYTVEIDAYGATTSTTVTTVPAAADGTATTSLTFGELGSYTIKVTSHSTSGLASVIDEVDEDLYGYPIVTSSTYPEDGVGGGVGVPGTFEVTATFPGVVSYTYSMDFGDEITMPADANGNAEIPWTPDVSGDHFLEVYANDAAGNSYGTTFYIFTVGDSSTS